MHTVVRVLLPVVLVAALALVIRPATVRLDAAGPTRLRGLDLYRPVPDDNPLTPAKVDLGRRLFNERRLSKDGSRACASCHERDRAFTNGKRFGEGVGGALSTRNVPAILNRAWGRSFFWDGRVPTLEDQVLQPILHPDELAMTPAGIVSVARSERYARRFTTAFAGEEIVVSGFNRTADVASGFSRTTLLTVRIGTGAGQVLDPYAGLSEDDAHTVRQVARALAAYVRTIQAGDAPYDRYVAGHRSALNASAQRGLTVFRGKGGCTGCHVGPTFTDEDFHNTGVAWRTGRLADEGRSAIVNTAPLRGAFKTPTLREVSRTAPYMHDGSFATLAEVIDHYDRGGCTVRASSGRLNSRYRTSGVSDDKHTKSPKDVS
ncbi:MAG: cytochrome-c peroxidase [Acidobacteria bacterium]|nr:cytochrome-c peroxidase [Acidobacteriota bacterium]